MLILLVVLILLFGGTGLWVPAYRTGSTYLAGLVAVILLLWLVFGGAHGRLL